ncbi:radical SAM/SPASM domain-containing protein [uncultured Selenomonas sp.]|uniref:radical SAM/SPASM domain-containing protein n=1 Tax=uncultured Selenomonas sp. TaxID=159275 RepID=UPI0025FB2D97|nr:radical SAM protein [uncultured Selenomonas sp.]
MQLYLLLTERCNLSCPSCIRGKKKKNVYLDAAAWMSVLKRNAAAFRDYQLLVTGGEPTLHPQMTEIIRASRPFFRSISINTNGVIGTWVNASDFSDIHVQVSLDGTPEMHNRMRGDGRQDVFSCVNQTIEKLGECHISYNISTTVNVQNYDNIFQMPGFIARYFNLRYWKISPELPFGCSSDEKILRPLPWNQLIDFLLDHARVRLKVRKLFDFALADRFLATHDLSEPSKTRNCGDVVNKVYVYPDLTVYPCTCLTDFPLGNLKTQSLMAIVHSARAEIFRNYTVKEDSVCAACKYLPICNGGCIGMSYHHFKELGRGDFRCPKLGKL